MLSKKFHRYLAVFLFLAIIGSAGWLLSAHAEGDAASEIGQQLQAAAGDKGAGLGKPVHPLVTVVLIIRVLLGLTSMVLIALIIYAGFLWMTAGGNEEQVTKGKTTIRNATIGLVIIISAYSITVFITNLARGYWGASSTGQTPTQRVFGNFLQSGN